MAQGARCQVRKLRIGFRKTLGVNQMGVVGKEARIHGCEAPGEHLVIWSFYAI